MKKKYYVKFITVGDFYSNTGHFVDEETTFYIKNVISVDCPCCISVLPTKERDKTKYIYEGCYPISETIVDDRDRIKSLIISIIERGLRYPLEEKI